ncbi:MAG: DUF4270 family protein [Hymenobacter sp.]|nr:MAG: DUF4270 family protein [Hymenobacter sp.]
MMRSNKRSNIRPLAAPALAARWGRLLLGLGLLLVAAACSTTPANIGVGLPSVDPTTGAYLVDTLTLRASTVLRDSVITSTSNYMLVGRYTDPQLGIIKASSYATLVLGSAFIPDRSQVADSVVLVLKPDTYRYGDTTKTQTLVEVRRLNSFLPTTSYAFAAPRLTPMTTRTGAVLNQAAPTPLRARRSLNTLRLRLDQKFGQELMDAGKIGQLTTQDQLDARCPGLALLPGASDDAALVRLDATSTAQAVILYYHDPTDPTTVLSQSFTLNGRHFYQAEAVRTGTLLNPLTSTNRQLQSPSTAEQTYIEGLLGLETKIEIPYLFDLRNYGQRFIITNATMIAEVPVNTLGTNLSPPINITVSTTDVNNRQVTTFVQPSATTPLPDYSTRISSVDGRDQAGYSWSVLSYCQGVLSNAIPNNGMLVNTATPTLPERVVLGGPRRTTNRLRLRLYLIRND